jgi:lipopolysaccharide transport system permease protein
MVPQSNHSTTVFIRPSSGWVPLNLSELVEYRELLYFLIWRDIKVRYKQTLLGASWAILQPLLTMLVFSIFFGRLTGIPSDGIPYPLFTYTALIPWQLFSYALFGSSKSIVDNQQLITKVYFPRLLIPLSAILAGLVDFVLAFVILLGMLCYYRVQPTLAIFTLPFFVLLSIATALGVGLWLSALTVNYRDVRHIIPFVSQFWFFVTPITYPSSIIPDIWRVWYGLNPMAGVVEGFRWALGKPGSLEPLIWISMLVTVILLITGLIYFRRMERSFADVV